MQRNRVVLMNESRLLRELLRRVIEKTPGFSVVDEVAELDMLTDAVDEAHAQWVVMSLQGYAQFSERVEGLLQAHPALRILAMATDGSRIVLKCVGACEENLKDVSLDGFIDALREETPLNLRIQRSMSL